MPRRASPTATPALSSLHAQTRPVRCVVVHGGRRGAAAGPPPFELEEATIAELQQRMQSGRATARSLAEKYLARIEAIDRKGPTLRSVIEVNPDALTIAERLDAERKAGGPRGPLHGIPILIKDNIDTADRMMTTAGSLALAGVKPPKDAFVVDRLREAGAVILGKTNLSEWANFRSTTFDQRLERARRADAGTRTRSIATPAARAPAPAPRSPPTWRRRRRHRDRRLDRLAVEHQRPRRHQADGRAGQPHRHHPDRHTARTPPGRWRAPSPTRPLLLGAMAGSDPDDAATSDADTKGRRDYTALLDADGLQGRAHRRRAQPAVRRYSPAADRLAEAAIAAMKAQGAMIIDPADIPTLGKFDGTEFDVLLYEFKADLNAYLDLAWRRRRRCTRSRT